MLHEGNTIGDVILSESDGAYIRLAAAKSVLRLSKKWDLLITPELFTLTILMIKDSSSFVRRSFLGKTFNLIKEHAIPSKYACALALAASAGEEDLKNDSFKYIPEFIKEYSREDQIHQSSTVQRFAIPGHPAYIVVYLVYVLAHDADFPPEDCMDERIFANFCSPLFFLIRALVDANNLKGDLDLVTDPFSSLAGLFRAIRKAEDAVDAERTPKLHVLSQIGSFFTRSLKSGSIPLGRTPDVILLPSAYYKVKNTKEFTGYSWGEGFIRRIIQTFNSYMSESVSATLENGEMIQENCERSKDMKERGFKIVRKPLGAKTLDAEKVAQWEVISGQKQEAVTLLVGESAAESPTIPKHKKLASNQNREKEECLLSSFNSVGEVTSLMLPQEKSQNEGRDDASIKENAYEIYQKRLVQTEKQSDLISSAESCLHLSCEDGSKAQNNINKTLLSSGDSKITCLESESRETPSSDSLEAGVTVLVEEIKRSPLQHCKKDANGLRVDVTLKKQKAYSAGRRKGTMACKRKKIEQRFYYPQ